MKWFFGFNEETEWFDNYVRYIKCAVNSARKNTDLEPHFLYDGKPNELTEWLHGKGVTTHYLRSRFYDVFEKRAEQGLNAKVASGAFLRAEIPDITYDRDPFVLYTDCDVMFLGNVSALSEMKPKHFACAPEFNQDDWRYFNSGVMVMNTKSMHDKMPGFEKLVKGSSAKQLSVSYDQEMYNIMYKDRWDRLPPEYNWKPYWGLNDDAKIIHFHGIKVENIERVMCGEEVQPIQKRMYEKAPEAYKQLCGLAVGFEVM
jgi:lipopolysaccharide biosynthesis glycosyltransferase